MIWAFVGLCVASLGGVFIAQRVQARRQRTVTGELKREKKRVEKANKNAIKAAQVAVDKAQIEALGKVKDNVESQSLSDFVNERTGAGEVPES